MLGFAGSLTRNRATRLFTTFKPQAAAYSSLPATCATRTRFPSAGRQALRKSNYTLLQVCRRCQSTLAIDPSVRNVASGLSQTQPSFAVAPHRIRVLKEPAEFYTLLLDMIRRAEQRIFISSLYIGSAESELIETMRQSLRNKPSVRLHMQLDLNRSTRPGKSSTAKILLPLLQEFPGRVTVSMFRSPSLRGVLAKVVPPRFNEGWGTWHAKIYGVDDEVIISGLSTTRDPAPHSYQHEGYFLNWPDPRTHPHEIHAKAQTALATFQSSKHATYKRQLPGTEDIASDNVLLFPIIQAGQFNIREEESALGLLFRELNQWTSRAEKREPLVDLTSGYFGLYEPYQKLVLTNNVSTRIVAASPKANGFFGSKGISGRIPEGYTLLEQRFMKAVKEAGRMWKEGSGVMLSEWEKDGWTYHAKGIWVSPSPSSPPILTLFGSTNLNSRSAHIDSELSFIMIVPSTSTPAEDVDATVIPQEGSASPSLAVRTQLKEEVDRIRAHATSWKGARRNVRFWTKALVRMVKGML
ncbi:hypothetical protein H0H92_000231 [Tricholoma furcatifolium]|nr:hypothetical protein H0H92_000231 [Tricholoma furcatifolium]